MLWLVDDVVVTGLGSDLHLFFRSKNWTVGRHATSIPTLDSTIPQYRDVVILTMSWLEIKKERG